MTSVMHAVVTPAVCKPLPLVTLSGPREGLPQVLCGPLLADDARGELKMRIGVRVGAMLVNRTRGFGLLVTRILSRIHGIARIPNFSVVYLGSTILTL